MKKFFLTGLVSLALIACKKTETTSETVDSGSPEAGMLTVDSTAMGADSITIDSSGVSSSGTNTSADGTTATTALASTGNQKSTKTSADSRSSSPSQGTFKDIIFSGKIEGLEANRYDLLIPQTGIYKFTLQSDHKAAKFYISPKNGTQFYEGKGPYTAKLAEGNYTVTTKIDNALLKAGDVANIKVTVSK